MRIKLDFIQSRIVVEKQKIAAILIILILIIGVFTIIGLYNNRNYLFGSKNIDTQEEIEKFYNSQLYNSMLHFTNIEDLKEDIVIETTTERQFVMVSQYGGFAANPTKIKNYTTYHLYKIEDKDFTIILCCDVKKANIDFSKNTIEIINKYKKSKINTQIIEEYSNKKPTYVFYVATNTKGVINCLILVEVILIIILSIIRHSKLVHKTSKLGKSIKQFGKYEEMVKILNMQVKSAIYKSGNVVVCEDYILLLYKDSTKIIKIDSIESIKYKPNEKYPDEIFTIEFTANNNNYNFDVYEKNIKEKIIYHIEKKIQNYNDKL